MAAAPGIDADILSGVADDFAAKSPLGFATHEVTCGQDTVVKRFQSGARTESQREWRALTLLARHAPGLAPAPVRAHLDDGQPVVTMSRLPGEPLISEPVTDSQLDAVALAVDRLHRAIPATVLAKLDVPWHPGKLEGKARQWAAECNPDTLEPVTRHAYRAARAWLDTGWARSPAASIQCPVFAQGDSYLANYLWDGHEVRLVDFEDAGRGDRVQELVDFAEHLFNWSRGGVCAEAFLDRFDLSPSQRLRALELRRLAAVCRMMMLLPGRPAHHRNPAGTLQRQAARVLGLLNA